MLSAFLVLGIANPPTRGPARNCSDFLLVYSGAIIVVVLVTLEHSFLHV